jgi:hypothetical protein
VTTSTVSSRPDERTISPQQRNIAQAFGPTIDSSARNDSVISPQQRNFAQACGPTIDSSVRNDSVIKQRVFTEEDCSVDLEISKIITSDIAPGIVDSMEGGIQRMLSGVATLEEIVKEKDGELSRMRGALKEREVQISLMQEDVYSSVSDLEVALYCVGNPRFHDLNANAGAERIVELNSKQGRSIQTFSQNNYWGEFCKIVGATIGA